MGRFEITSDYAPSGDQPRAISQLIAGIDRGLEHQVLLGVTGSGKTFTMASVIAAKQCPAIVVANNKILAAQLYEEMKLLFPNNAVEYFVSYYDYYKPEAYIPHTDMYIEKDALINEKIDMLRHSATRSILERRDVIVVASVSCIYGLGAPELYLDMAIQLSVGMKIDLCVLQEKLVELQYKSAIQCERGSFSIQGDTIKIFPSHYEDRLWRISFFDDEIDAIQEFDPKLGSVTMELDRIKIFPNSHYVTPRPTLLQAITRIEEELQERVQQYRSQNKVLEAERILERTKFDIEMIRETGTCKGIENYSRHLCGKKAGDPPHTLFDYLPDDALMFIDESHITVPQIRAMYNGDRVRKANLVNHGFRLPSALDNRPLTFEEWEEIRPTAIYVSATPGQYEIEKSGSAVVEQIIRPTWLLDPICIVRSAEGQIQDIVNESVETVKQGYRVMITTLTKKMAENLAEYMQELGIRVGYLHSDVKTLDRIEIMSNLRAGEIDVLVGVNLLREGLDVPECALVGILDADKEGFLRSTTSLIQTMGRAARNINGRVILYADHMTNSIRTAIEETERRRRIQAEYNCKNGVKPRSINKLHVANLKERVERTGQHSHKAGQKDTEIDVAKLHREMLLHAENLEFEKAIEIRNKLRQLATQR